MALTRFWFILLLLFCTSSQAAVQTLQQEELPNYAFAPFIGSGIYATRDRTVTVFNFPLSYDLRTIEEDGWGLEVTTPVTIGLFNFDFRDLEIPNLEEQLGTLSFVPGLHFHLPVSKQWILTPLVDLGVGKASSGSDFAWIYSFGLESRYNFDWRSYDLLFGNRFRYAGYQLHESDIRDDYYSFETGLDVLLPTHLNHFGWKARFNAYAMNQLYFGDLDFINPLGQSHEVDVLWEIGFTVDLSTNTDTGIFELPRIGLGYRFGDGLGLIRLVFGRMF
ncbi:MAG: AsmA family protein [gamma proteobacterium endosymbiont of Lamellibrachia anaximandri]|nr:AsmA family protein [gamma proteobacterium endosymbiont of Lamellibrachia anaximandri]MBL3616402.1 AsmA family protein [gamma proteobacterium endosymbiont of Lamellibrachia anaximandri]